MSLNWNISKVVGFKATGKMTPDCNDASHNGNCEICPKKAQKLVHDASGKAIPWAVTNGLIWLTMVVQLGEITEKNVVEFATRVAIYQKLNGAYLIDGDGKPREITAEEVRAHVGLYTNVTSHTRTAFLKCMTASLASDCESEVRDALKPAPVVSTCARELAQKLGTTEAK